MSSTPFPSGAFPFRLAACDLDGTLLGPHKEISAANRAAVSRLQENGTRFVIASGRRHQNSIRFYNDLQLRGLMISCAGALVQDPATGEVIREVLIPAHLATELVERGERDGWMVIYYHRDGLFVNRRDHWTELYESRVGEKASFFPGGLGAIGGDAALKIVWYGDPEKLSAVRPALDEQFGRQLAVLSTDKENLEFVDLNANKAAAVSAVADYYRVERTATLAFGDGENDASMLRWVRCGVAVDGANRTAREAARIVGPPGSPEERFARAVDAVFTGSAEGSV